MALSTNAALNATLALIHGDMSVVRAQLRAPGVNEGANIPQIVGAVLEAIEGVKREAVRDLRALADRDALVKELTGIQIRALSLNPAGDTDEERRAFMAGVEQMELLLNGRIGELKRESRQPPQLGAR